MQIIQSFSMDFKTHAPSEAFRKVVYGKQYDSNTRYLQVTLMNDGAPFVMPAHPVLMVGCRLPDGNEVLYDLVITATPSPGLSVVVDPVKWKAKGLSSATFTYNGSVWERSGSTVTLSDYGVIITNGTPQNGNTIAVSAAAACTYNNNIVTVGIAPSCFAVAGDAKLDLYISDGDKQIGTFSVTLRIERAAANTRGGLTPQSFVLISDEIEAYVNSWLTLKMANYVDEWLGPRAGDYIAAWLAAHPEATTTVQDLAITVAKLNNNIPYVDSEGYICMKGDWE